MHGYGKETLRLGTEIVGHSSSNSARTAEKTEILIHFRLRTILSKKYVNARHEKWKWNEKKTGRIQFSFSWGSYNLEELFRSFTSFITLLLFRNSWTSWKTLKSETRSWKRTCPPWTKTCPLLSHSKVQKRKLKWKKTTKSTSLGNLRNLTFPGRIFCWKIAFLIERMSFYNNIDFEQPKKSINFTFDLTFSNLIRKLY